MYRNRGININCSNLDFLENYKARSYLMGQNMNLVGVYFFYSYTFFWACDNIKKPKKCHEGSPEGYTMVLASPQLMIEA